MTTGVVPNVHTGCLTLIVATFFVRQSVMIKFLRHTWTRWLVCQAVNDMQTYVQVTVNLCLLCVVLLCDEQGGLCDISICKLCVSHNIYCEN